MPRPHLATRLPLAFVALVAGLAAAPLGAQLPRTIYSVQRPTVRYRVEPIAPPFVQLRTADGGYLHTERDTLEAGVANPGWHSAHWVIESVVGTKVFRLRNRYRNTFLHVTATRALVSTSGTDATAQLTSDDVPTIAPIAGAPAPTQRAQNAYTPTVSFQLEPTREAGYVRLRAATGGYVHDAHGPVQIGAVADTLKAAMWQLAPAQVTGHVRLRNRASARYLHNQTGALLAGAMDTTWRTAMWTVAPIVTTTATTTATSPAPASGPTAFAAADVVGSRVLPAVRFTIERSPDPAYVHLRTAAGYAHMERGPLEIGAATIGWWSMMWVVEPLPIAPYVRFRNRYRTSYLDLVNGVPAAAAGNAAARGQMWNLQATGVRPAPLAPPAGFTPPRTGDVVGSRVLPTLRYTVVASPIAGHVLLRTPTGALLHMERGFVEVGAVPETAPSAAWAVDALPTAPFFRLRNGARNAWLYVADGGTVTGGPDVAAPAQMWSVASPATATTTPTTAPAPTSFTPPRAGDVVASRAAAALRFTIEPSPAAGYVHLRTAVGYVHAERGPVEVGAATIGWWSMMWAVEPLPTAPYFRFRNRYRNTHLQVGNGGLALGPDTPAALAQMWSTVGLTATAPTPTPTPTPTTPSPVAMLRENAVVRNRVAPVSAFFIERTPDGFVRLRLSTGRYAHMESGYLGYGPVASGSLAAMWAVEAGPAPATWRLRNRVRGSYLLSSITGTSVGPRDTTATSQLWWIDSTATSLAAPAVIAYLRVGQAIRNRVTPQLAFIGDKTPDTTFLLLRGLSGGLVHMELGAPQVGIVQPTLQSTMWVVHPASQPPYFRLRNRARGTYLGASGGRLVDAPLNEADAGQLWLGDSASLFAPVTLSAPAQRLFTLLLPVRRVSGEPLRVARAGAPPTAADTSSAYFRTIPGLAGRGVSFESVGYPGHFLVDAAAAGTGTAGTLSVMPRNVSAERDRAYRDAATFLERPGLAHAQALSFESGVRPGQFLRVTDSTLAITPQQATMTYRTDASFVVVRRGVTRPDLRAPDEAPAPRVLWVATGTLDAAVADKAGTDAAVSVQVVGTRGMSAWITLDKPSFDDFERGDRSLYPLGTLDVGRPTGVRFRSGGGLVASPRWLIESVCLHVPGAPPTPVCQSTRPVLNEWLATGATSSLIPLTMVLP